MARITISQLSDNQLLEQAFQAVDKQLRVNRQGGKYVLLKLADRTGTISAMIWNADERTFESFQRGDYVFCRGRSQIHNGNLQIIVTDIKPLRPDEVNLADFDRFDSQKAEVFTVRLSELLGGLTNVHLRRLGQVFLGDADFMAQLKVAAAAVSNHHAYPGGLLQHTVDLMELAQWVGPRYPQIDTELLIFGAFLHDLGKLQELTTGSESTYTDRGQLIGHLVLGVQMLGERIAKLEVTTGEPFPLSIRTQLEHLILSHHGMLEFGSPKVPQTLEAIALHHLDNLDAKLSAAVSVIQTDVGGDENWTNYNPAMGRKFWKPKN